MPTGAILYLIAAQTFEVRHVRSIGGHKVRTLGYAYAVSLSESATDARLAWHWHPGIGPTFAHSHIYVQDEILGITDKWHLPSSRVFLEQILAFLIDGLGVTALVDDWQEKLSAIQRGVEAAATWRGANP